MCGFLQFVPRTTAHQQYSSKELAHSYECVLKLKVCSVLLAWCCAEIMGGKHFYQATKSTLMPGKAVATSYLLNKAVNEERSHSRVTVQVVLAVTPLSPEHLAGINGTTLVSPLASPPVLRAVKCKQ